MFLSFFCKYSHGKRAKWDYIDRLLQFLPQKFVNLARNTYLCIVQIYNIMYNQKYKTAPCGVWDNHPKVVALCDLNSA